MIHLPIHPTKRHPHTGKPLRAIYVRADGRVFWPVMGGDDTVPPAPAPAPAPTTPAPALAPVPTPPADPGFPANTPVVEMTIEQQAAYYKHQSQKHEGRFKSLVGDRSYDQTKADLDAYAEVKKSEQTPAEQALAAAREEGKAEATSAERNKAATAIFRGALESGGVTGDDLEEIVSNFNVSGYVSDDGVDTSKITNFAKRFSIAPGTGNQQQRNDYGAGRRPQGGSKSGVGAGADMFNASRNKSTANNS